VQEYLQRSEAAGLVWPLPENVTDEELEALLFPPVVVLESQRALPDMAYIARELRRKGVTLMLLWEEYRRVHPEGYAYSRYCDLYRDYVSLLDPRMRLVHKAGEKLFVDYAGLTMEVKDRAGGEPRTAQIFVATLGASDYTYVEATWTQTLEDWIASHVRAFEFLGGTPKILVPDNLKSGVTTPHRYEPLLNETYAEMARHYNLAIIPARAARPRDKAKVENHVLNVERRILAPLRDRTFLSLEELNLAIALLLADLNSRPFQQLPGSRRSLFEELEQALLTPLPVESYEFARWKKVRVALDYHVCVEQCYYSVPCNLLKEEVEVRISSRIVEVYFHGRRVASHARSFEPRYTSTTLEHMPKSHQRHLEWTPVTIARWARDNGPSTSEAIESILTSRPHPEQGYRSCLGVMRLAKEFGADRLEAACLRALRIHSPTYKSIASILKNGLDQSNLPAPQPELPQLPVDHTNVRGAAYYRASNATFQEKNTQSC
jgi:transposase